MRFKSLALGCALALLLGAGLPVLAENHEGHEDAAAEPGAFARNLAFVGGRTVDLAGAIPADKYGWRPMEGVRSVSEVVMHIAGANYFFASRLGTPVPEGVEPQKMEEVTDKAACTEALEASMEHLKKALDAVEDRNAKADIFGREGTVEDMMLIALSHVHEHFGQLIAYARSNQVVPPWSQGGGEG